MRSAVCALRIRRAPVSIPAYRLFEIVNLSPQVLDIIDQLHCLGLVEHAESTCCHNLALTLTCRTSRNREKTRHVSVGVASAAFCDVRWDRHRCSSKLLSQTESLINWELRCRCVYVTDEGLGGTPCPETSEVAHGSNVPGSGPPFQRALSSAYRIAHTAYLWPVRPTSLSTGRTAVCHRWRPSRRAGIAAPR